MATPALEAALCAARTYIERDPSPETRSQAERLVAAATAGDAAASKAVVSQFGSRLEFGTAGLRGEMAPGCARMNDLTVLQAAQGIAEYVASLPLPAGKECHSVVIGFDHRARGSINSRRFAIMSAAAFTSKGIAVHLFARLACTPLVPFGVRHFGASAGVMVTASHNPKNDDGYKVYGGSGAQIVSPVDKDIARRIFSEGCQAPWPHLDLLTSGELLAGASPYGLPTDTLLGRILTARPELLPGLGVEDDDEDDGEGGGGDPEGSAGYVLKSSIDEEVTRAYVAAVAASQCHHRDDNTSISPVGITYTAMHGVGRPFAQAMARAFGLPPYTETAAQVEPDPAFPTVEYPNPEEGKGALALAMEMAAASGSTLILANDPDADRLAVACWVPAAGAPSSPSAGGGHACTPPLSGPGEWRVLTGNEIGALLAAWVWEKHRPKGRSRASDPPPSSCWMVASAVSSKLLRAMAAAEGFTFVEVLTGFKYHGTAMADAITAGARVLFAFEEAIGFACGDVVRDKDGVCAAAVFAEMAQHLARTRGGLSVVQRLGELYAQYGHFVTNNGYLLVDEPWKNSKIFSRLRNEGRYWARLPQSTTGDTSLQDVGAFSATSSDRAPGFLAITAIRDLTSTTEHPSGFDSSTQGCVPTLPVSSGTNMLTFTFENGAEVTLRTSGTEPKLKWYAELCGSDPAAARAQLGALVEAVVRHMLQPHVHGLKRPGGGK